MLNYTKIIYSVLYFNILLIILLKILFKLRKGRFDGERTWAPNVIGDNDFVEDSIDLDDTTTYRSCIRAENPQTEQSSNSFCITFVTGSIVEGLAQSSKPLFLLFENSYVYGIQNIC